MNVCLRKRKAKRFHLIMRNSAYFNVAKNLFGIYLPEFWTPKYPNFKPNRNFERTFPNGSETGQQNKLKNNK